MFLEVLTDREDRPRCRRSESDDAAPASGRGIGVKQKRLGPAGLSSAKLSYVSDERVMSVTEARELAVRAHAQQRDRDGSFHLSHVSRVAEHVPLDDAHQRVAWLHDVLEDCELSVDGLTGRLSAAELAALSLLAHDDPHEGYAEYVQRIIDAPGVAGDLARSVKEADLLDNLRRCARDRDPAVEQYGRALAALWTAAPNH